MIFLPGKSQKKYWILLLPGVRVMLEYVEIKKQYENVWVFLRLVMCTHIKHQCGYTCVYMPHVQWIKSHTYTVNKLHAITDQQLVKSTQHSTSCLNADFCIAPISSTTTHFYIRNNVGKNILLKSLKNSIIQ